MQCPVCNTFVPLGSRLCPHCGFDLAVLQSFNNMKREWRQAQEEFFVRLNRLQDQFDSLETLITSSLVKRAQSAFFSPESQRSDAAAASPTSSSSPTEAQADSAQEAPPTPTSPPQVETRPLSTSLPLTDRNTEVQFGQKWLLLGGITITVLGLGFFLKYAFEQNWVGPAGRVTLAYLAATVFLGVGELCRRRRADTFGLSLVGGGIATLYLTTFAASQIYQLIGQIPAFGFMILVTVLAGTLALLYDAKWLAVLGVIGGFLTPVLLRTGQDNQLALMSYLTLLNAGILAIAAFRRWNVLNFLGFGFTWLLFSAWYGQYYTDEKFWWTIFFLNLFFLIYAVVPFVYYFARVRQERMTGFAIMTPNAFIAFAFSFITIRAHTSLPVVSVATLAYAGLFLWMARALYQRNRENLDPIVLLLAQGLFFLLITVPILFSGHWITIFWAAQALALLWAALRLQHRWLYQGVAVLLVLTVGKFVLYDYDAIFGLRMPELSYARGFTWLLLERWLTTAVVLGTLFNSAYLLKGALPSALQDWKEEGITLLLRTFALLLFLALNCEVAAFFFDYAPQARFAAISVLWALFAATLMGLGFARGQVLLRQCALGLFAVTVLKVFLWDMANVSTPFRIISFIVLGLMLIGASYLYYRYRERLVSATPG